LSSKAIVVPCFNEERRLEEARFLKLAERHEAHLLFVDDGSRDRTLDVLERLRSRVPEFVIVHALPKNQGKAEAVRQGLTIALGRGFRLVGYADADLATPPAELLRMLQILEDIPAIDVAIGSRVLLIGRRIERKASRHYLGRVFATFAANVLRAPFYDTQCGAKFFRKTPALEAALEERFVSRWAFDVELLGRLLAGTTSVAGIGLERMREIPLEEWIDKPGSKLRFSDMASAIVDLGRIELDLDRRRIAAKARSSTS
jgi:dolichyl-phosphate beta-glucosyltransferase